MSTRDALHLEIASLRKQLADARERARQLEQKALKDGAEFIGVADLNRQQSVIVAALVKSGRVSTERLYTLLEIHGSRNAGPDLMKTLLNKIRRKLAPHGVAIKALIGFGFEMSSDDRNKLRALVRVEAPPLVPAQAQEAA